MGECRRGEEMKIGEWRKVHSSIKTIKTRKNIFLKGSWSHDCLTYVIVVVLDPKFELGTLSGDKLSKEDSGSPG